MILIAIIIGCLIGALIGMYAPMVSYTYSGYLAIAIIAALDSVFGGIVATLKKNFNLTIFITGFFGNAILAILLTILGQKLNVDIYLAAIIVFVGRMFTNLAIIRRYYIDIVMKKIEEYVRSIPDFPEPGIIFRDITSVLQDADGLQLAIDSMQDCLKDVDVDVIVGTESRGFIFGMPIAYNLHKPFVPVRKKGKLPCETISASYDLEYGKAEIEIHKDAIKPGQKVVIIDDLIATGGTVEAAAKLIEQLGGEVVKIVFLMELAGLKGREKLAKYDVKSVIRYDGK